MEENCIFCKIIKKEIPSKVVYEDDDVLAFYDIAPVAPGHILFIPKEHFKDVNEVNKPLIWGRILEAVQKVVKDLGIDDYRLVVNKGEQACQTVFHLHIHLLWGRSFTWPPG